MAGRPFITLAVALAVSVPLAAFSGLPSPQSLAGTLYTVAGIAFSVGMGVVAASTCKGVANRNVRRNLRRSLKRVRDSYLWLFAIDTVLYVASAATDAGLAGFVDWLSCTYSIVSIVYFVVNFLELQHLGFQIDDQMLKESGTLRKPAEACAVLQWVQRDEAVIDFDDEMTRDWTDDRRLYVTQAGGPVHRQMNVSSTYTPASGTGVKRDFRARYDRIAKTEWFKKTYSGKSLGDMIEIDA